MVKTVVNRGFVTVVCLSLSIIHYCKCDLSFSFINLINRRLKFNTV